MFVSILITAKENYIHHLNLEDPIFLTKLCGYILETQLAGLGFQNCYFGGTVGHSKG